MSRPLFDTDFSAIEARITPWLAGQQDALDEYRAQDAATTKEEKERRDRYRIMATEIYSLPIDQIDKGQRFIGKQGILLCQFQGGPDAFVRGCAKFRVKVSFDLANKAVGAFRAKHKRVTGYWYDVERAAQKAIANKGQAVRVSNQKFGDYAVPVYFLHEDVGGIPFLLCKLPSGRKLAYPRPRLVPSPKFEGKLAIKFFGKIGVTQNWGDVDTYGGKLVENITQAVAADIMCNGAQNAEDDGFAVMALIHDQALSYTGEGQTAEEFSACLTSLPDWAEGLPIEAEGGLVPFYKKD